jgi:hypothetical protein
LNFLEKIFSAVFPSTIQKRKEGQFDEAGQKILRMCRLLKGKDQKSQRTCCRWLENFFVFLRQIVALFSFRRWDRIQLPAF